MQFMNKKILSLLLVIALFFCGICYEEVPAYSSFSCENTGTYAKNTSSEIRCVDISHFSEDYRCEELVRGAVSSNLINQAFKRITNRTGRSIFTDLHVADFLSQYYCYSHNSEVDISSNYVYSHTILMNYIHMKDGKKS